MIANMFTHKIIMTLHDNKIKKKPMKSYEILFIIINEEMIKIILLILTLLLAVSANRNSTENGTITFEGGETKIYELNQNIIKIETLKNEEFDVDFYINKLKVNSIKACTKTIQKNSWKKPVEVHIHSKNENEIYFETDDGWSDYFETLAITIAGMYVVLLNIN